MHPPALSAATASVHEGRFEVVARNTIVNTTVAMAAFVIVGVLVNLIFIALPFTGPGP